MNAMLISNFIISVPVLSIAYFFENDEPSTVSLS